MDQDRPDARMGDHFADHAGVGRFDLFISHPFIADAEIGVHQVPACQDQDVIGFVFGGFDRFFHLAVGDGFAENIRCFPCERIGTAAAQ